jgi:RNA polymerase sigma factor (TIGR02999 family)
MSSSPDDPGPLSSGTGQPGGADHARWVAALYEELRALAKSELGGERAGHTLSATALVNEVYLKFSNHAGGDGLPRIGPGLDRGVFFGLAAQAMRRILVDYARSRRALKRGGGERVRGSEAMENITDESGLVAMDPERLDEALGRLAVENEQTARIVELRFFAGLPDQTIAECLGINERTVRRHWTFAKAWLAREMDSDGGV